MAYLVGGAVRDFLLNREAKDHDIATDALPDDLIRLFPKALTIGKAFGVIKVPMRGQSDSIEIATFRSDGKYLDGRRPEKVNFSSPEEDAYRRDFTINGLFYDPKTKGILDAVSGMTDLDQKVIRAIGDPIRRFEEDGLRLLRGIRFAALLGFQFDSTTWVATHRKANRIQKVSSERIRDELNQMLLGPRPAHALELLKESGLLFQVLPELDAMGPLKQAFTYNPQGTVWDHTLRVYSRLTELYPERNLTLAWGTLLRDVGKPVIARRRGKNFNGHEIEGAKLAEKIMERLRFPKDEVRKISALVHEHLKFRDVFSMREATLQRWIREPHFEELLQLHHAEAFATDGNLAYYEFLKTRFQSLQEGSGTDAGKLVRGEDLIQLGLTPGPRFSEILRVVEDLSLENRFTSKEEALEFVVKHFVT